MSSSEQGLWRYRRFWLVIGWLWIVSIWYLSLTVTPPEPDLGISFGDKILHAGAYGLLTVWFLQLYHRRGSRVTCMLAFIAMGVLLEYLQSLTDYRQLETADMLANTAGVFLAWIVVRGRYSKLLLAVEEYLQGSKKQT